MTNGPPNPFRDPSWASIVLGLTLTWTHVSTIGDVSYGRYVDASGTAHYLVPCAAGSTPSAGNMWTLSTTIPAGFAEHLITSPTATALLSGTSNSDGTLGVSGTNYKLQQTWVSGAPILHMAAA